MLVFFFLFQSNLIDDLKRKKKESQHSFRFCFLDCGKSIENENTILTVLRLATLLIIMMISDDYVRGFITINRSDWSHVMVIEMVIAVNCNRYQKKTTTTKNHVENEPSMWPNGNTALPFNQSANVDVGACVRVYNWTCNGISCVCVHLNLKNRKLRAFSFVCMRCFHSTRLLCMYLYRLCPY